MSFRCHDHGWTHLLKPCPSCQPEIITTNSVNIPYIFDTSEYVKLSPTAKDEKIKSLEAQLQIAVEALEFYADEKSWDFTFDLNGHESYEEIKDDTENTSPAMSYGGKRAREALAKIREGK